MRGFLQSLFYFTFILVFVSCGDSNPDSKTSKSVGDYVSKAPIVYNANFFAKEAEAYSLTTSLTFSEDVSTGYTFTISNKPSWSSLNTFTGELSGTPDDNGHYEDINIIATKTADSSTLESGIFSIGVNGDPLRKYAWHLNNTGQKTFSLRSGTVGQDMGLDTLWSEGITGLGVKIAISDSGVDTNHDDLYLNALSGEHRDYTIDSPYIGEPTPTTPHGTAVAGLINATGWNNRGSIGIAPKAKFAAFQFLSSAQTGDVLIDQASGDFNIFNFSYGDVLYSDTRSDEDYLDHIRDQVLNNQKVYVKSSGNEFVQYSDEDTDLCASHNANFPFENESPFIIVVGAINADGEKATYSSAGSNLWITSAGGEYGSLDPAMLTTDLPTCFKGYSEQSGNHTNSFEFGHSLNTQCHYTSTMNGTSSAAPTISGVIALMLQAKPSLTQRDIKHILAQTAIKVDPTHSSVWGQVHPSQSLSNCNDISSPSGHVYEQGWVTNAASFSFNNFYGFGLVDAKAAVDAAKVYTTPLATQVELNPSFTNSTYNRGGLNVAINKNVTDSISVINSLTVESVQVRVSITHEKSGVIGVELTSPSGTKSILMNINNSFLLDGDSNLDIILTSHAFYGETSSGSWTIKVIDGEDKTTGTLKDWKLNILGY